MRFTGLMLLSAAMLLAAFSCKSAQKSATAPAPLLNQQAVSADGDPMLLGRVNRNGMLQSPFATWFNAEYTAYTVDNAVLTAIENQLKEVDIEVFMGTWCSDSHREVPHFYKILDHLNVSEKHLTVIALDDRPDRYKTSPQGEEQGKNIDFVPTLIFLRDGKELGRIVESPQVSLEADMVRILTK